VPNQWLAYNMGKRGLNLVDKHMSAGGQSALVVLVPEAEGLVSGLHGVHDPSAAQGMPAHITILYPFLPPPEVTGATLTSLERIFAQRRGFAFRLKELRRFPGVLYLAPTPDEPFREMTHAVVKEFPGTAPYGGAFGDVPPHLTVALADDERHLDAIAVELEHAARGRPPLRARARAVALMETESGPWQERLQFRLS
jgi:hypothetical protein